MGGLFTSRSAGHCEKPLKHHRGAQSKEQPYRQLLITAVASVRFKAILISPQKSSRHTEANGQMGLNTQHLQSSNKPLASRGNGLDLITVFSSEHMSDITASILERKVIIHAQEEERVAGI